MVVVHEVKVVGGRWRDQRSRSVVEQLLFSGSGCFGTPLSVLLFLLVGGGFGRNGRSLHLVVGWRLFLAVAPFPTTTEQVKLFTASLTFSTL